MRAGRGDRVDTRELGGRGQIAGRFGSDSADVSSGEFADVVGGTGFGFNVSFCQVRVFGDG